MSNLLIDTQPLVFEPELACAVGLNEAIVMQQVHYWVTINKKKNHNFFDGYYWVYNTIEQWNEQFPWWHKNTIARIFSKLERDNLIVSGTFNKNKMDRTKWYRINYDELRRIKPSHQNCEMGYTNLVECNYNVSEINSTEISYKDHKGLFSFDSHRGNCIEDIVARYGQDRFDEAIGYVDWYIDEAYPEMTGRKHKRESEQKRAIFAAKLLECADRTEVSDNDIFAAMELLHNRNPDTCKDPNIYYLTTPKVLGYWIAEQLGYGYGMLQGTGYEPVDQ